MHKVYSFIKSLFIYVVVNLFGEAALKYYHDIWGVKKNLNLMHQGLLKEVLIRIYEGRLTKWGSWIGYESKIGEGIYFPHGILGVFISNNASIGKNCVVFQQVTIGSNTIIDSKSLSVNNNCLLAGFPEKFISQDATNKILGNIR